MCAVFPVFDCKCGCLFWRETSYGACSALKQSVRYLQKLFQWTLVPPSAFYPVGYRLKHLIRGMCVYGVCVGMGMRLRKASYWLADSLKSFQWAYGSLRVLSWLYGAYLCLYVSSPVFTRSLFQQLTTIRLIIVSYGFWLTQLGCGANLIFSFLVWVLGCWCWCSPCVLYLFFAYNK